MPASGARPKSRGPITQLEGPKYVIAIAGHQSPAEQGPSVVVGMAMKPMSGLAADSEWTGRSRADTRIGGGAT